jgi:WS/DGAT/MGAT family acyltransferase
MAAAPQRMSRVDTAWLRMDSDVNLMMIVGIWLLRPALRYEALCERLRTALLRHPRFRRKVVEDALGYAWADDEHLDIERHVSRERLAVKGLRSEREALQARAAELASEPLDRAHPLWHWHLVEDYDGGSACIIRIHHCIGDGIALMRVLLSITDGGLAPARRERAPAQGLDGGDWLAEAVVRPLTRATVKAIGIYGDGLARSIDLLADPARPLAGSLDLARLGLQVAHDAAALAMMDDDSPTRLKGEPAGIKRLAWCEPLPLADVKAVARAMHCTVNDVLLACVAGAIGGYLRSVGDDPAGKQIRAMVPVNLRPPQQADELGNGFGLVPLVLPIGIEHPIERLYAVHARMNELKGSYQPLLAFMLLAASGLLVKPAQDRVMNLFARKTTAVMTNVPGPPETLKFCGSTLAQMLFWVPQSGRIGVGVSILSYGGGVQFGLVTDKRLCPDPQRIIDRCAPEFAKLLWVTMMLPWGEQLDAPAPPARQSASPARSRAASGGRRRGAAAGASASTP